MAKKSRKTKPPKEMEYTMIFNGKSYSRAEWEEYSKTGEPARIISEFMNSDQCPPDQKAAWDSYWDSVLSRLWKKFLEEEERQKENAALSNTASPDTEEWLP